MRDENGPPVPELARRATLSSAATTRPRVLPVLTAMPAAGIPLGDILADSGYAHRDAGAWAIPLRRPARGSSRTCTPTTAAPKEPTTAPSSPTGTCIAPDTPRSLLELGPLAPGASPREAAAHDGRTAELARYKLGRLTSDDDDGYHRVQCPAAMGKIRCPIRPASMTLNRDRPQILTPPEHPPACCQQLTITVPPDVHAKTAQKHDYPSTAHRRSYNRRTGAERGFATTKDPATNDISRGWCRLMGLTPLMLCLTTLLAVRNQRIIAAWNARQRQRPPSRCRAAPENPQTPPHQPRPAHRRAITTRHHQRRRGTRQPQQARPPARPATLTPINRHRQCLQAAPRQPGSPARQDHRRLRGLTAECQTQM